MQFSFTGGCSQRNGPRLSAWQLRQMSFVDAAAIRAGETVPWGLWQEVQVIQPSLRAERGSYCSWEPTPWRSGMWALRYCWLRRIRWHWAQVSITFEWLSIESTEMFFITWWQLVQGAPRISCGLPFQ